MAVKVHPLNREVTRGPGGVWNEHILPILSWEASEQRVVLPAKLVASLTLPISPVLRWDAKKYQDVIAKHARDRHVIDELSSYVDAWQFHGEETGVHAGNLRVLFEDATGRWYAVSMGQLQGSDNVITVFGSSKPNFVKNRLQGMNKVVMKGEK